jgi:periplasmic protein TonB
LAKTARKPEPVAALATRDSIASAKRKKLPALLVTRDDELWQQIGAHLSHDLIPKQVDSIDELLGATHAGQPAIVLWDARGYAESASVLSRLQSMSARSVIIALDDPGSASAWTFAIEHRQIAALVTVPVDAANLIDALDSAQEEVNARIALLGDATASAAPPRAAAGLGIPWVTAASIGGVLIAGAAAFIHFRHHGAAVKPVPALSGSAPQEAKAAAADAEEKVDALIERAQQAMLDRHFIEPVEGSALSLYRSALILDPGSGEARQGLQRLAEVLVARVQSALDERKFDVALQALETARSIAPDDSRLPALDERFASLRAELGPAEIQAAINAQNYDRAAQLLDEAARAKMLSGSKVNQLRDEIRRRRGDLDTARFLTLADARLQQDHLIDPHNDSAAYYLDQARQAGADGSATEAQYRELLKRLAQAAQGAADQHRIGEADRLLAALRNLGAPPASITNLQHALAAARAQQARERQQPQILDLARSRLAQGNVLEPEDDSALYYVNQLRSADPQNPALTQISGAVQSQILERARAALDAAQSARAEALLQVAAGLGNSTDLDAFSERLRLAKLAANGVPQEVPEATLTRARRLDIEYPTKALAQQIEGAVDIAYTVTPKGTVADIRILASTPPGVFDAAATTAVSRMRYKPVVQSGKAVAVVTKLRVSFHVAS